MTIPRHPLQVWHGTLDARHDEGEEVESEPSSLENAAAVFNAEADALNEAIEALEDRLERARAHATVWLPTMNSTNDIFDLGYARVDGRWRLAVRRLDVVSALRDAPLSMRVAAAHHLAALIKEITTTLVGYSLDAAVSVQRARECL